MARTREAARRLTADLVERLAGPGIRVEQTAQIPFLDVRGLLRDVRRGVRDVTRGPHRVHGQRLEGRGQRTITHRAAFDSPSIRTSTDGSQALQPRPTLPCKEAATGEPAQSHSHTGNDAVAADHDEAVLAD